MIASRVRPDLPWHVYVLLDPRNGAERYVGWTHFPRRRFQEHFHDARRNPRTYKARWLHQVFSLGLLPLMVIIESGYGEDCVERERFWIKWYKDHRYPITNLTEGGDGISGFSHSMETIDKIRRAHQLRVQDGRFAPVLEKLRRSRLGSKASPETRLKQRLAHLGVPLSENHRKRMLAATSKAIKIRWEIKRGEYARSE